MSGSIFLSPWSVGLLLIAGAMLSFWYKKLTGPAACTGAVLGLLVFLGTGFPGLVMLGLFFLLGTLATGFKLTNKENIGVAEKNKGRRKVNQVLANAGTAGLFSSLILIAPELQHVFTVAVASSFSVALADTLSSELGSVYGRKAYNIITLKRDERGLNGVVSLEGFLIGLAGSALIVIVYATGYGLDRYSLYIIIGGTIGNLCDSLLGATLERKGRMGNDEVNFVSVLVGSVASLLLCFV